MKLTSNSIDNKNDNDDDCTKLQLGDNSIFRLTVCPILWEKMFPKVQKQH